jgi:hypothetical protein
MAPQPIPLVPDRVAINDMAMVSLARAALATIHSMRGQRPLSTQVAKKMWGDRTTDIILRAASDVAQLSDPAWAGVLAQVASAYLAALVPLSAGADLLQRGLTLSFGSAGKISVPGVFMPAAGFVGPGQPIPAVEGTTSIQTEMEPYKFAVIVGLSREMFEGPNVEAIMRAALIEASAQSLDAALFSNVAGTPELHPPGLLYGVTPITASSLTDMFDAMVADLSALANAVAPRAGNGNLVYAAAPRQAAAINLRISSFSYPLLASSALADGQVIAIASNALVAVLEPTPRLDASGQVAYHRETNPVPIVKDDGTIAVPVASTFQTDGMTLRLRWPLSWAMRAPDAIAVVNAVKWPAG